LRFFIVQAGVIFETTPSAENLPFIFPFGSTSMTFDVTRHFIFYPAIAENRLFRFLVLLLLILVIFAVYWPVQNYGFIDFDDQIYVTGNHHVQEGLNWASVIWALQSTEAGFWHPLTWISLMTDYSLYGLNAGGYHWTNLLFHVASTFLLFSVLVQMTGAFWRSLFVAALFGLHPLHVEPVAWVAARKDILSTFFWMLAMKAYVTYAASPGLFRYILLSCAFMLGLMSKPMVATLPFVLLLLDYWPLERFSVKAGSVSWASVYPLLKEKVPLILMSVIVMILTVAAEKKVGALKSLAAFPLDVRISTAVVSYAGYLEKTFWPMQLAVSYPHPGFWPLWQVVVSCLLLLLISYSVFFLLKNFHYLTVGWLWYLGVLIPVIGLIQIGSHAMADRYTYLPLTGLFMMIAWGMPDLFKNYRYGKTLLSLTACAILIGLAFVSSMQVQTWSNNLELFKHTLEVTGENQRAHHGLGMAYHEQGDRTKAIFHLREALRIKADEGTHNDLGFVFMAAGQYRDAEKEFQSALSYNSDSARAHNNLGASLASQGKLAEAVTQFREALRLDSGYKNARSNLNSSVINMERMDVRKERE
jgi:protein O-mannosyl-transferase